MLGIGDEAVRQRPGIEQQAGLVDAQRRRAAMVHLDAALAHKVQLAAVLPGFQAVDTAQRAGLEGLGPDGEVSEERGESVGHICTYCKVWRTLRHLQYAQHRHSLACRKTFPPTHWRS